MGRKKVTVSYWFTPELAERLKALSVRTHVPQSHYVREAVERLVGEKEGELSKVVRPAAGAAHAGRP